MRISRRKRPKKPLLPTFIKNWAIEAPEVMVIDDDGANLGAMKKEKALEIAQDKGLDLVLINPKSDPPACKIVEFADFKYQKEKQARKQKAKSHASEMKGVRLSVRISEHDMEVKAAQAKRFLERGDKVKIELILRGRENARADIALGTIDRFVQRLAQEFEVRVEQKPTRQGRKFTGVIARK